MNIIRTFLILCVIFTSLLTSCATSRVEYIDTQVAPAIANPGTVVVAGLVAGDSNCAISQIERGNILHRLEKKLAQKRRQKDIVGHLAFEGFVGRTRSVGSGSTGSLSYALTPSQMAKAKKFKA